jgi:hypothetical protein
VGGLDPFQTYFLLADEPFQIPALDLADEVEDEVKEVTNTTTQHLRGAFACDAIMAPQLYMPHRWQHDWCVH